MPPLPIFAVWAIWPVCFIAYIIINLVDERHDRQRDREARLVAESHMRQERLERIAEQDPYGELDREWCKTFGARL